jgi:glycine/D-amino acid oxidase-like deaminating enzyme
MNKYHTVIIGGGFYGLRIAQYLYDELSIRNILVVEKEADVMQRASYNNQARVHNGYHYPRSVLTALRSRVNLPIFSKEYPDVMVRDIKKYYAVATHLSKVSGRQFERFYDRIGARIDPVPEMMQWFNPKLIEQVFEVEEYAFNTTTLKKHLLSALKERGVGIHISEKVESVSSEGQGLLVKTDKGSYATSFVLNTTYSSINRVNLNSGLPIIPFKHELTEMCLVKLPPELEGMALTIMCGPFFSIMPFPDKNAYTLSHVRYTPHSEWFDTEEYVRDSHAYLDSIKKVSHFPQMLADVKRYMPIAAKIEYTGESLWEVKTVLPQSEGDDSRPILYKENHGGLLNYICLMGGKIDNIYDVFKELSLTYEKAT